MTTGGPRAATLGPADIHALTGLSLDDIVHITAVTDLGYTRGRPRKFKHRDRALLVLVALRTNLTERALAAIFGISQPTAHRAIRDLMPKIADLFEVDQFAQGETLLLDGTLIPGPRLRSHHHRRLPTRLTNQLLGPAREI